MLCFCQELTRSKVPPPQPPPPLPNKEEGSAAATLPPSEETCLVAWVGGCFLSRLTGVLVLALQPDGRGPGPGWGLSVGFGVAAAAASSSGEPQTSRRRRRRRRIQLKTIGTADRQRLQLILALATVLAAGIDYGGDSITAAERPAGRAEEGVGGANIQVRGILQKQHTLVSLLPPRGPESPVRDIGAPKVPLLTASVTLTPSRPPARTHTHTHTLW